MQDQASQAGRLGGLIDAALAAAGVADEATAAALSSVVKPTLSPAPQPVAFVPGGGGDWGGQGALLPSRSTGQPAPAPDRDDDEHGWAYNAFGGFGSGMWKIGPGAVGDVIGWVPWDRAQAVDDMTDREYDDLSDGYGADTDGGVYRVTDVGTQVVGLVGTGGMAAVRSVPAAFRGGRAFLARGADDVTFLSYRSGQTITNGDGGFVQAHHTIQDAAVRGLPGHDRAAAPSLIMLRADHAATFAAQRGARVNATYGRERGIATAALLEAGYSADEVVYALKQADEHFLKTLGWTMDTRVNAVRGAATAAERGGP